MASMRLRFAPTSPFVRKVRVAALETGLDGDIERITVSALSREDRDASPNPLGKVPCLETGDGMVLYDSPVIIDYLDTLHAGPNLIPPEGRARWDALRRQALADGILENTVLVMIEGFKKPERRSEAYIAHNRHGIARAVDALEQEADALDDPAGPVDIGMITVGIALDFIDMHFPDDDWRTDHPKLAAWFETFRQRPSMQQTTLTDQRKAR